MSKTKQIRTALISVYDKDGLDPIVHALAAAGVKFLSTGGTQTYIEGLGYECEAVESLTGYPSIFGGRVKTLHPAVFGGILYRRDLDADVKQAASYRIPAIDLVIVDLYPFEATVASGASAEDIIEKIDIGGISLIRAAAKNFSDVAIVASKQQYAELEQILADQGAATTEEQRRHLAAQAFAVSSGYDTAIFQWFTATGSSVDAYRLAQDGRSQLRYGENPHQEASFYGKFNAMFDRLHGKEISYNNLLDIDSACALIREFQEPTFAVIKHNNACGLAVRATSLEAWTDALACDPVSAFGGVIVTNRTVDAATAAKIDEIFFEVLIAPDFDQDALDILFRKKNRIILRQKADLLADTVVRTACNGLLVQQRDTRSEQPADLNQVTGDPLTEAEIADLLLAARLVKHAKSNAIVLARNGQLLAAGVGQTSRVDSLRQAIAKARAFGFDLQGASMASDAFFPFADCVQIAHEAGIKLVVQPGGSIRDGETIDFCKANDIKMALTGIRHFRH